MFGLGIKEEKGSEGRFGLDIKEEKRSVPLFVKMKIGEDKMNLLLIFLFSFFFINFEYFKLRYFGRHVNFQTRGRMERGRRFPSPFPSIIQTNTKTSLKLPKIPACYLPESGRTVGGCPSGTILQTWDL